MANGVIGSLLILLKAKSDVQGLLKTEKAMKRTSNTASLLTRSMRALSAIGLIFGGKSMLGSYLEFEKSLGAIHSRFYAITKDSSKANMEFEKVRGLAKSLGMDMFSLAESYSIFFAGTAKSLGEDGAKSVFESWSKVGRVLHMTPYQMERVTYALREMASKGAIYSQDLRMQIGTHVPNAMGLATQAIKNLNIEGAKTFDDFQKKAKGNQPLINRFIKEFTRLAELQFASPEAMREALKQPDALAGLIKAYSQDFLVEFSRKGGNEVVLTLLNAVLDVIRNTDFNALAKTLSSIFKVVGALTSFLIKSIPILTNAIIALATAMVVRGISKKIENFTIGALGSMLLSAGIAGQSGGKFGLASGLKGLILFLVQFFKPKLVQPLLTKLMGFMKFLGPVGTIVGILTSIFMAIKPLIDKWWKDTNRTGTREDLQNVISYLERLKNEHPDWSVDMLREAVKDKYMMVDGAKVTITFDNKKEIVVQGLPTENKQQRSELLQEFNDEIARMEKKEYEKQQGILNKTLSKFKFGS